MKRILVVRTDRVGDVVVATPLIRELRKTFPDAFITALVRPNTKNILLNNPNLNEIITDDLKKENFWKVVKQLRKYKFTHGLLLMPTERAAYQMFLAGIKNRVGVGHKLYEVITGMKSVSRNNYIPLRHEADYCMDLGRKIGVKTNNLTPEIFLTEDEKNGAVNFLEERNIYHDDFKVIIHTGSLNSAPNWSEDKYFNLIKRILEEYKNNNLKIILTAIEMSEEFKQKTTALDDKRIINIAEDIDDLRKFIKVIYASDVLISSSTGPAHLAGGLNKNSIILHCHRPMSCVKRWGVLCGNAVNLEVSEEYCKKNCSADQENCDIENGISINSVMTSLKSMAEKILIQK